MRNEYELDSGTGNLKYIVLGAVALVFAVGAYALIGKEAAPVPKKHVASAPPAVPTTVPPLPAAVPAESTPIAAAEAQPDRPATPDVAVAAPAPTPDAARASMPETASQPPDPIAADMSPSSMDELGGDGHASEVAREDDHNRMAVRKPPPPAIDSLDAWWRAKPAAAFNVQYVGQAADRPALVIRLSQGVAVAKASGHLQLLAENGTPVPGAWQSAANGFVLVHDGLAPGRYTLKIDAALASASGKTLPETYAGPVYIQ